MLSAPLGVGVLFAGLMRGLARGPDVSGALAAMSRGQAAAAATLRAHGARAMTDVTGFGLVGHVERLLAPGALRARIDVDAVPLLPGALDLARAGVRSSAWANNRRALERFDGAGAVDGPTASLLADPQTAGGLLAIVPAERAGAALAALRGLDVGAGAAIVGELVDAGAHRLMRGTGPARAFDARRAA